MAKQEQLAELKDKLSAIEDAAAGARDLLPTIPANPQYGFAQLQSNLAAMHVWMIRCKELLKETQEDAILEER